uniref:Uncharacterized protein n=1 Tax=Glossina austeni TaxID=7395 RepID=A0A1A9UGM9_GLOAU
MILECFIIYACNYGWLICLNTHHYCRRQHQVKHLFKLSSVGFKYRSIECRCWIYFDVINNNVPSWHVDNINDIYHVSWSWFIVLSILNYSLFIKSSSAAIGVIIKANSNLNV